MPRVRAAVEARWLSALPRARCERLLRLRQPADRAASLAGLALLCACARAAGLSPPPLGSLCWPGAGKPFWPGGPDFSISHGGGRVGCALVVPRGRVGLDLEDWEAARPDDLRLLREASSTPLDGSPREATRRWVATEAALKAAGASVGDAAAVRVEAHCATFAGVRWTLHRPALAPRIACAVACDVVARLAISEEDAGALLERGP